MEFGSDASTRHRVARSILVDGPSTAAALAERMDLTPAAVRRHLDVLLEEGAVEARDPRLVGALAATAFLLWKRSMVGCIVVGMLVITAFRLL